MKNNAVPSHRGFENFNEYELKNQKFIFGGDGEEGDDPIDKKKLKKPGRQG